MENNYYQTTTGSPNHCGSCHQDYFGGYHQCILSGAGPSHCPKCQSYQDLKYEPSNYKYCPHCGKQL
jgi:hypothetical protein